MPGQKRAGNGAAMRRKVAQYAGALAVALTVSFASYLKKLDDSRLRNGGSGFVVGGLVVLILTVVTIATSLTIGPLEPLTEKYWYLSEDKEETQKLALQAWDRSTKRAAGFDSKAVSRLRFLVEQ